MNSKFLLALAIVGFVVINGCQNTPGKVSAEDLSPYLERGQKIAGATFVVLSENLQSALKTGGVSNAIAYCNLKAMPLTDSLSKVHQVQIRRTTLQPRNPQNAPSDVEKVMLRSYSEDNIKGKELKAVVHRIDERTVAFYAPIRINTFCLQCHGNIGSTMTEENGQLVRKFYPEDEATGYEAGDLRGIWSISFRE